MLYYYKLKVLQPCAFFRVSIATIGSKFNKINSHNSKHASSR
jgi:hypothetical protein